MADPEIAGPLSPAEFVIPARDIGDELPILTAMEVHPNE
ncbi:hypothetical protein SEA_BENTHERDUNTHAT_60 [Gordonia phage BENtherdunthat]|uniref:Uncharacterized protein n=1 Tax=Gordonia phage BENtherdunthat TaxID=2047830 RepID=A0A2H4PF85_9CAUD|nr:hypothetical protein HOS44_gp060 [Gordonia phage BENtherdunthat]ATW60830.1 hypothetical protein SEA_BENTHERDUNTHAT_60 [Gordonia phage BENtherdunthat]